ncbi:MAG: hypothetical protein LBE64_22460 [Acinetobacter pittii]|nr:hypothetical protein [Acinetobacter pittii]
MPFPSAKIACRHHFSRSTGPQPHINANFVQIGLGEDGPTHQPIETVAHYRALPNCNVWRPAGKNSQLLSRPKPPFRFSAFFLRVGRT